MKKKTKIICSLIAGLAITAFIVYVGEGTSSSSMLRTVLQLGTIYALVAVSMNLLNGFTGLFSLGQAGFMAIIKKTKIGMAMRAVSKDFQTAKLMGIEINTVISVTFIIGCFLAALGSMLYFTPRPSVFPLAGSLPGLKCFVAAVFGGIGSIPGAVLGGFLIGLSETFIKAAGYSEFSDVFTFVLLIAVLMFRPTGLFGETLAEKV